jgi:hypothetical protein
MLISLALAILTPESRRAPSFSNETQNPKQRYLILILNGIVSNYSVSHLPQELLRHAHIRTTMNIHTRAVSERPRKATSKLVRFLSELQGPDLIDLGPRRVINIDIMMPPWRSSICANNSFP